MRSQWSSDTCRWWSEEQADLLPEPSQSLLPLNLNSSTFTQGTRKSCSYYDSASSAKKESHSSHTNEADPYHESSEAVLLPSHWQASTPSPLSCQADDDASSALCAFPFECRASDVKAQVS